MCHFFVLSMCRTYSLSFLSSASVHFSSSSSGGTGVFLLSAFCLLVDCVGFAGCDVLVDLLCFCSDVFAASPCLGPLVVFLSSFLLSWDSSSFFLCTPFLRLVLLLGNSSSDDWSFDVLPEEAGEAETVRFLPETVTGGLLVSCFCFFDFLCVEELSICFWGWLLASSVRSTARTRWLDLVPLTDWSPKLSRVSRGDSGEWEGFSLWFALALLRLRSGDLTFLSGADVSLPPAGSHCWRSETQENNLSTNFPLNLHHRTYSSVISTVIAGQENTAGFLWSPRGHCCGHLLQIIAMVTLLRYIGCLLTVYDNVLWILIQAKLTGLHIEVS